MPDRKTIRRLVTDDAYIAAARAQYERDGEIEIDFNATVSRSDDSDSPGAYVQAWVWVDDIADSTTLAAEDKDPITEREALSLSYQLWDRISKLPDDEIVGPDAKANALRAMGWDPNDVLNHCFACEYTRNDTNDAVCTRCPITTWREEADYEDSHPCIYGSYGYFVNVKTPTERRAAAIAIRDLMQEKD